MRALRSSPVLLLLAFFVAASGSRHALDTSRGAFRSHYGAHRELRLRPEQGQFSGLFPLSAVRLSGGGQQRGGPYALRQKDDTVLKKIAGAESVADLVKIVKAEKYDVDRVGASFYVLAQLCEEGGVSKADVKAAVSALTDEADRRVLSLDRKAVSSILWSLATISGDAKLAVRADSGLVKSLATRAFAAGHVEEFTSLEVANVLWALSRLGHGTEKPVLDAIMARVAAIAEQFNPKSIAHVLWAMATLKVQPPSGLVGALCKRGQQLAHGFDEGDIKEAVWALQHLEGDRAASSGLKEALEKRGGALTTESIAEAVNKLSSLGVQADASAHPAFVPAPQPMGKNPVEQLVGSLAGFVGSLSKKLQGVGEKLQGAEGLSGGSAGLQPGKVAAALREALEEGSKAHAAAVEQVMARGREMAGEFRVKDVVSTLQALAESSTEGGGQLVKALSERGQALVAEFDPAQIAATVAALGSVGGQEGRELVEALGRRGREIAGEFGAKEVAETLQALAASGQRSGGQLWEAMGRRGKELVGEFSPGELAKAMEALAGVAGSKEGAALMAALGARGQELASRLSSGEAASMLAALAARGEQDSRELWGAVAARAQAVAGQFSAQDLGKALAALAAAGDRAASSEVLQALVARGRVLAPTLEASEVVAVLASLAEVAKEGEGARAMAAAVSARGKALAEALSAQELANIMAVLDRFGPSADPELVRLLRDRAEVLAAKA